MDRSVLFASGTLAVAAFLVAVVVLAAPVTMEEEPRELMVSNGNSMTTVGESVTLHTRELSLVEIFERTESGTVRVEVKSERPVSVGSGFVFDSRGHIITNAHVVDNSDKIVVTFLDGRSYNARIIGEDPFTDIAVIRVDANIDTLKPLVIGDSSGLKVGERIAAIGNPFGLSGSMTAGIVSQLGRLLPTQDGQFSIPDVIQTDAAINPGNSGGPLLNTRGEVVGINTAIQSATGEFTGVGFAVPSQTILKIVPVLIIDGKYSHPWLGITGLDVDPDLADAMNLKDTKGFLVVSVISGSPADRAGLHGSDYTTTIDGTEYRVGGDVIVAVDGIEVRKIDDILIHLQRQKSVGDELVLDVIRDGRITTIVLVLEERPGV